MVAGYKPFLESTASSYSERHKFSNQVVKLLRRRREMEKEKDEGSGSQDEKPQHLDFTGLLWKRSELTQSSDNAVLASTAPG